MLKRIIKLITQYGGLPRPVYILFVSKIVDAAGCFIWPLLALILTRKAGLSSLEAGTVSSIAMIASALSPFLGGKLADIMGRKATIALFTGAAIISYSICGFIPTSITMVVFIVLGMTFLGAASPAHDALVADLVPTERRQSAYSLLYLGWNVGFAAGPAIGAFLLESHLNLMFIGDAATALAALVMVMLFVPETRRAESEAAPAPRAEAAETGSIIQVLLRRPVLLVLTLILFGYSFTYVQWGFLLPLQLSDAFSEAGARAYGIVALVNGITVIIANPTFTLLFKRTPLPRVVFLGGIFYAVGFGLMGFASSIPLFYLLSFVFTLGEVSCAISVMPFIMARTPSSHRGRMGGAAQLLSQSGSFVGPIAVGAAITAVSIRTAWIFLGSVTLAFSVVALVLERMDRRNP